ncbi:hypothetical protein GBA52_022628 [Prunus armeniaca]|nr:hypothetical protein GBA52_022628 [Prunus armeniaca]
MINPRFFRFSGRAIVYASTRRLCFSVDKQWGGRSEDSRGQVDNSCFTSLINAPDFWTNLGLQFHT